MNANDDLLDNLTKEIMKQSGETTIYVVNRNVDGTTTLYKNGELVKPVPIVDATGKKLTEFPTPVIEQKKITAKEFLYHRLVTMPDGFHDHDSYMEQMSGGYEDQIIEAMEEYLKSKQLTPNPYGFLLGKKMRYRYVDWDVNNYTIWSTCTESDLRKFDDASIESIEFKP